MLSPASYGLGGGVLAPNSDIGPSAYHLIDLEADIAFRHLRVVGGGVECPRRSVAIRTVLSSSPANGRLDRLTIRDAEVPRFVATDQSGYKQGRTVFGVAQDQIQVLQTRQALVESAKAVIQRSAVKERVQINRMTKAQKCSAFERIGANRAFARGRLETMLAQVTRISTLVSVLLTSGWPRTPLFMRVGKHSRR